MYWIELSLELLSIIYKLCFFEYLYTLGKNFFKSSNPFQFSITTANFIKVENLLQKYEFY